MPAAFIPFKLKRIDQEYHLSRIGINQNNIRIKRRLTVRVGLFCPLDIVAGSRPDQCIGGGLFPAWPDLDLDEVAAWRLPMLAARLGENIEAERTWLLDEISKELSQ